ncbi:hypothetical protein MNBD_GAMMA12-2412 [hydrothermal vent metagenome]|uniref:Uncharacterized protein n=1 Tax=hydrothermal vent metagenome TaxID=652676 RepID=A0A3B0YIQ8_9ZZZZ
MTNSQKFYEGKFLIPSFVYIIGFGGLIVMIQLIMVYIKTGKGVVSDSVDVATIIYTTLTAIILLFSVLIPLLAYAKRKKQALVSIGGEHIYIREKALKKEKCFIIKDLVSLKLYVDDDEKRSSMRLELKSGEIILLQFAYVLIAKIPFKSFMKQHCNIIVLDW